MILNINMHMIYCYIINNNIYKYYTINLYGRKYIKITK